LAVIPARFESRMSHRDADVLPDRMYYYRLRLIEHDGEQSYSATVAASAFAPDRTSLHAIRDAQPGPIPIRYTVGSSPRAVRLAIYSPTGRLVRALDEGRTEPGEHLRYWDRRAQDGGAVARGVYLVHLRADGASQATRKVLLLHE
jgi:hypothetical protein